MLARANRALQIRAQLCATSVAHFCQHKRALAAICCTDWRTCTSGVQLVASRGAPRSPRISAFCALTGTQSNGRESVLGGHDWWAHSALEGCALQPALFWTLWASTMHSAACTTRGNASLAVGMSALTPSRQRAVVLRSARSQRFRCRSLRRARLITVRQQCNTSSHPDSSTNHFA